MIEISSFISNLVDFVYPILVSLFNFVYTLLTSVGFVMILRIIILIFFLIYVYRIFKDFSMFSGTTCIVLATGLAAILELFFGLFGYLASVFSGLFLFLGKNLGVIVAILVVLIGLLVGYYILSRIGWQFKKERIEKAKRKAKFKEHIGRKAAEILGGELMKTSTAGELAKKATRLGTLKGVSPPVKKKK